MGQKICGIKFRPCMQTGGEIDENFLLANISGHKVCAEYVYVRRYIHTCTYVHVCIRMCMLAGGGCKQAIKITHGKDHCSERFVIEQKGGADTRFY